MPYSTAGKNKMLAAIDVTHVSLHTANPGDTGANEVAGGTYARIAVTENTPSGGAMDLDLAGAFNVPAGTTITHVGYWSSTTFLGYSDITDETFGAAGTYTLTDADLDLAL
jgi:hypothetical protein